MAMTFARRVTPVVIGMLSMFVGLMVASGLAEDRCIDGSGRWNPLTRACLTPAGTVEPIGLGFYAVGLVAALAVAWILGRAYAYRARQAASREAASRETAR